MAILVIVESPAKAKTIEKYLGSNYRVAASVGHIRDLPERAMGVQAPDFKPEYVYSEKGKEVVARLKRLAAECDDVILASDMDREGEAIAWHLQQVLGLNIRESNRITFTEITKSALHKALDNPRPINLLDVAAQEARRITDRFIGYKAGPVIAESLGDRTLSVGRVQSIAVRLVADREEAIAAHKSLKHYSVRLSFDGWSADLIVADLVPDGERYWTDSSAADCLALVSAVEVDSSDASESRSSPPAPFMTTTLQAAGSNSLGFSPKKTMELAQKLYEQGAITYMRTDSCNLSEEAYAAIEAYCDAHSLPRASSRRSWKTDEDAQGAHEAIRPSDIKSELAGESEDERKLYQLIWKRTICSQLEDAKFAVQTSVLSCEHETLGTVRFLARGKRLIKSGWKMLLEHDSAVDQEDAAKAEQQEASNPVPSLTLGSRLEVRSGEVIASKTNPPGRFTEASLVQELKKRGIGRPSTYGAIIENITTNRGYVEVFGSKKQLRPSIRGTRLIKAIRSHFKFIEYDFTKILETQLEAIATQKTTYKALLTNVYNRLEVELESYRSSAGVAFPCPKCGRGLLINAGKDGGAPWWGCSGFEANGSGCDFRAQDDNGSPGAAIQPVAITAHACGSCGRALIHRVKEGEGGWSFFSCSGFKDGCQQSYPDVEGLPDFSKPKIKSTDSEMSG